MPANDGRPPDKPPAGSTPEKLSATAWAEAALAAIGRGGLAAVAVEPLAAELGTTKGSFYWHFPNRRALVESALEHWERVHTEGVISTMESEPDPTQRLRNLFDLVVGYSRHDRIEVALLANADDPLVAPVMQRVTERRIDYVASLYAELGWSRARARDRAVLAVSAYLGHLQLAHAAPTMLPDGDRRWRRYMDSVLDALVDEADS